MNAYIIADIEVHDLDSYQEYIKQAPSYVEKHQGKYLVRAGNTEVIEGDWQPRRLILLEFPSPENAMAFINDPEYAKVASIRQAAAHTNAVWVEGC